MIGQTILIVTEANEEVASGHLFECIVCCEKFIKHGRTVHLLINSNMQSGLKERITVPFFEYGADIQKEEDKLVNYVTQNHIDVIIFNLRKIENYFLNSIRNKLAKATVIVCIDEFGHRRLSADIIINPMIDEYYWDYETSGKVYSGERYLILPQKLNEFHRKKKEIRKEVETITVSMGGVDAVGMTVKLADWLDELFPDIKINFVLGGGFAHKDEFEKIIKGKRHICVYYNITFLYELFMDSDIAVCAGGNTLHELAAIGVPTLVIPGMPHEYRNGKAFEKRGFSICCEKAECVTKRKVKETLEEIFCYDVRVKMCRIGKEIVDGKGAERVYSLMDNIDLFTK